MARFQARAALLAATAVLLVGAADAPQVLTIRSDEALSMTVNGVSGRVRVDPSAVPRLVCNPDFAARAHIVPQGRAVLLTDPADVYGSYGTVTLNVAGRSQSLLAHWLDRAYVAGADCVMAPEMTGAAVVQFTSGRTARGERTIALPLNPGGPTSPDWNGAAATAVRVGNRDISVGFTFTQATNSVTANAALRIADGHGGRFAGEAVASASPSGRERLLRRMVLQQPLAVGPLAVGEMQVRVSDWGSARRIKTLGTVEPPADPGDVKVVARFEREDTFERLMIGGDLLRRCSSIVIDRPAGEIRLTCG